MMDIRADDINPAIPAVPADIAFGSKPHQKVSLEVASMMLQLWFEREPKHFGAYNFEIMTGEPIDLDEPGPRRRRRAVPGA